MATNAANCSRTVQGHRPWRPREDFVTARLHTPQWHMVRGIEFGEGIVGPELSRAHRQVLAFVGAYLHGYDCLPSTAEVAEGCGLGSSRKAGRLLHDLESVGILVRDPRYSRLGELRRPAGTSPIDEHDQLWLCELGLIEVSCVLEAIRRGLAFAPDAAALGEVHSDGVQRALELQAYEGARRRLADVGANLGGSRAADVRDPDLKDAMQVAGPHAGRVGAIREHDAAIERTIETARAVRHAQPATRGGIERKVLAEHMGARGITVSDRVIGSRE